MEINFEQIQLFLIYKSIPSVVNLQLKVFLSLHQNFILVNCYRAVFAEQPKGNILSLPTLLLPILNRYNLIIYLLPNVVNRIPNAGYQILLPIFLVNFNHLQLVLECFFHEGLQAADVVPVAINMLLLHPGVYFPKHAFLLLLLLLY